MRRWEQGRFGRRSRHRPGLYHQRRRSALPECTGNGFPNNDLDRNSLEPVTIAWLVANPEITDWAVIFDYANMFIIGESRTMAHQNIGCTSCELV